MANIGRKLTQKQKKFAQNYVETGNASQSYISAGYSAKTVEIAGSEGAKLLKNPLVVGEIDRLNSEIASKKIASATERQQYLTAVMRSSHEETKDRIRATEILGKMQGDFIERVEIKEVPTFNDDVKE